MSTLLERETSFFPREFRRVDASLQFNSDSELMKLLSSAFTSSPWGEGAIGTAVYKGSYLPGESERETPDSSRLIHSSSSRPFSLSKESPFDTSSNTLEASRTKPLTSSSSELIPTSRRVSSDRRRRKTRGRTDFSFPFPRQRLQLRRLGSLQEGHVQLRRSHPRLRDERRPSSKDPRRS